MEARLSDALLIARRRRATARLASAGGVHKTTLLRWAVGQGAPARGALVGMASWLSDELGNVSREDVLSWLLGASVSSMDAHLAEASRRSTIRSLRESLGISQMSAALAAGVSRATWVSWEARDAEGRLPEARGNRARAALRPTQP